MDSLRLISSSSKPCAPCQAITHKITGCNHMPAASARVSTAPRRTGAGSAASSSRRAPTGAGTRSADHYAAVSDDDGDGDGGADGRPTRASAMAMTMALAPGRATRGPPPEEEEGGGGGGGGGRPRRRRRRRRRECAGQQFTNTLTGGDQAATLEFRHWPQMASTSSASSSS